ncbi:hypothetical protein V2J09_020881 [Rumex salicifolius]
MENSGSDASHDFSDSIFWFLEENCRLSDNFSSVSSESIESADVYDDEEGEGQGSVKFEENKAFWDTQEQLLMATLCRTTSIESRVRQATKEALMDSNFSCACRRSASPGVCRSCLRNEVFHRLSAAGYNCSVRNSKWNSSSDIPAGEHSYIEVVGSKKGVSVRVIVELHFRAEFEMARAGEDYDRLVSRLPEVFVGKAERLRNLVKILCGAAKRCMKQNNIHMGPWRKQKYMLAKWLSSSTSAATSPPPEEAVDRFSGGRAGRPKASMLTFALLENLPRTNCHQAVAVV